MPIVHERGNKFAHRLWVLHQIPYGLLLQLMKRKSAGKPRHCWRGAETSTRYIPPQTRTAAFLAGFC